MILKVNFGVGQMELYFVFYKFLINNLGQDINSTNLPCLTSVLADDASDSRDSSKFIKHLGTKFDLPGISYGFTILNTITL